MDIRMVLKCTDSMELYTDNKPYAFSIQLPRPLTLKGYWSVALLETFLPSRNKHSDEVYIYTNLCEDTIVGNRELPLLRKVHLEAEESSNKVFTFPYEVPVRLGQVHDVHVYIKDTKGLEARFLQEGVSLTLQLRFRGLQ